MENMKAALMVVGGWVSIIFIITTALWMLQHPETFVVFTLVLLFCLGTFMMFYLAKTWLTE